MAPKPYQVTIQNFAYSAVTMAKDPAQKKSKKGFIKMFTKSKLKHLSFKSMRLPFGSLTTSDHHDLQP